MKHAKLFLLVVFFLASCATTHTLPASTQTFAEELSETQTPIPTATATIAVTSTPDPTSWILNDDSTFTPPQNEYALIEEAAKKFLTASWVLEDIGSDPTTYPALKEKEKLVEGTYNWAQSQHTYYTNFWYVGRYNSFKLRCFNEKVCEATYLVRITGMIANEKFCSAYGIRLSKKGNCLFNPPAGWWVENDLMNTLDWYERTLVAKTNDKWYAISYSPYPANSAPTPWLPK